jgi:hypothetical protein
MPLSSGTNVWYTSHWHCWFLLGSGLYILYWRWRHYVPLKRRRTSMAFEGVLCQRTVQIMRQERNKKRQLQDTLTEWLVCLARKEFWLGHRLTILKHAVFLSLSSQIPEFCCELRQGKRPSTFIPNHNLPIIRRHSVWVIIGVVN